MAICFRTQVTSKLKIGLLSNNCGGMIHIRARFSITLSQNNCFGKLLRFPTISPAVGTSKSCNSSRHVRLPLPSSPLSAIISFGTALNDTPLSTSCSCVNMYLHVEYLNWTSWNEIIPSQTSWKDLRSLTDWDFANLQKGFDCDCVSIRRTESL